MKIVSSILLMFLATTAFAQDEEAQLMHGRVSFAEDSGLIKGTSDAEWSFAALNSLVMPGDQIWADEEGVLELEFSGGTFIRLADGSRMEVVETPPTAVFQGWQGSFYIQRMSRSNGEVRFETPVGYILVDQNTQVRVDILKEGATTISVRWGAATFADTEGRTFRISGGKRIYVDPGYSPSEPTAFNRSDEDSFDQWNRERARALAVGTEYMPVLSNNTADTPIGMRDLNDYGEWVYTNDRYFWRPTVVAEYVPYRNGSWSYVPAQGHVWVGNYPFSYVTSHHGFWHYDNTYGWIWAYNGAYSPAYAATVRYGDRFVWSPLGLNGQVAYWGDDYFVAAGVQFSYGLATWAYVDHVLHGGYHTVYQYHHHHHHHYHSHHHHNHYWDLHNHHHHTRHRDHYRPYDDHRGNQPRRDYTPRRTMRGSDQDRSKTRSARATADRLFTRNSSPRTDLRVLKNRDKAGLRTPLSSRTREAAVRDIRIRPEATTRTSNSGKTIATRRTQRTDPRTGRDRTTITTRNTNDIRTRNTGTDVKTRVPTGSNRVNTRTPQSGSDRVKTRAQSLPSQGTISKRQQNVTNTPIDTRNLKTRQPASNDPRVKTRQPDLIDPRINQRPSSGTNQNRETRKQIAPPRATTRQQTPSTPRVTTRQQAPSTPQIKTRQQVPSKPQVITRQPSRPQVITRQPSTRQQPTVSRTPQRTYTAPQTRQSPPPSSSRTYSAPRSSSPPPRSYSPPSRSSRSSSPSVSSRSSSPSRSYSAPSTSSRSSSSSSRSISSSGGSSRGGRVR